MVSVLRSRKDFITTAKFSKELTKLKKTLKNYILNNKEKPKKDIYVSYMRKK
jgi:hypothetical protein